MRFSRCCGAAGIFLILILSVFSSGCVYESPPGHDVIVIRLGPDGSQAWVRVLDDNYHDIASDVVETSDGEFVIAAGASAMSERGVPKLVRLAGDGTILSEHPCRSSANGPFSTLVITSDGNFAAGTYEGDVAMFDRDRNLIAVTPTGLNSVWGLAPAPDGGVVAAGALQQQYPTGSVAVYDANGNVSARATLPDEAVETPECRETIIEAGERKIPEVMCVAPVRIADQAAVVFLDRNGNIVRQHEYGGNGLGSAWSIAPAGDRGGYYLSAYDTGDTGSDTTRYAAYILENGTAGWVTDLGPSMYHYPSGWAVSPGIIWTVVPKAYPQKDGLVSIHAEAVQISQTGEIMARHEIPSSRIITPIIEGGFFSAGFPSRKENTGYVNAVNGEGEIHATKYLADGFVVWDRVVGDGTTDTIRQVIQTRDGGYVILAQRENG
jgi:hypothetical protein